MRTAGDRWRRHGSSSSWCSRADGSPLVLCRVKPADLTIDLHVFLTEHFRGHTSIPIVSGTKTTFDFKSKSGVVMLTCREIPPVYSEFQFEAPVEEIKRLASSYAKDPRAKTLHEFWGAWFCLCCDMHLATEIFEKREDDGKMWQWFMSKVLKFYTTRYALFGTPIPLGHE